jgi:nitroimidazol reductase NimA-like FMN-containing flavoprotein (pyridoxamine 5'-phosphate oxidase superfamily)
MVDRNTIDEIILEAEICYLSCCLEDLPYLVPLSFGYDGQAIYIHTAAAGKKITIFERNPQVCLAFVPQAEIIPDPDQACEWSVGFSSVIAEGKISEITDLAGKTAALNQIMVHYSDREWDMPDKTISGARVWKIELENLTGKVSPTPT